jgi:hypothetical protein
MTCAILLICRKTKKQFGAKHMQNLKETMRLNASIFAAYVLIKDQSHEHPELRVFLAELIELSDRVCVLIGNMQSHDTWME